MYEILIIMNNYLQQVVQLTGVDDADTKVFSILVWV